MTIKHRVDYSDQWFSHEMLFKRIKSNHEDACISEVGTISDMKSVCFAVAIAEKSGRPYVRYNINGHSKGNAAAEQVASKSPLKRPRKENENSGVVDFTRAVQDLNFTANPHCLHK